MVTRTLILGGYGNFGSYISKALSAEENIQLIIAGRNLEKAENFSQSLDAFNEAEAAVVDIKNPREAIKAIKPNLVIHAVGPFQDQDYRVAEAAIAVGADYCDLADARTFVCNIDQLDTQAKSADAAVIAGASSVPCLTAAYLDDAMGEFRSIESVDYGISAAQQTNRGLGTASAILSYVGRSFGMYRSERMQTVFGWQGIHSERYPELGRRWFGYCDIPDLDLFPARYKDLKDMRFCAGHEISLLHFGTWLLSWGVRLQVLPSLDRWSEKLLKTSFLFDRLGSARSGFHMYIEGIGHDGTKLLRRHWIIARQGHGPNIPCLPVIILAKRMANGEKLPVGARPCLDLIALEEYLAAFEGFDISVSSE